MQWFLMDEHLTFFTRLVSLLYIFLVSDKAHGGGKNMGGTADQMILKRVKHASKMADTSSERVATDFLEKRVTAQDFLEEFLKERQRYHMLAAKIECMKRDIRF